MMFDTLDPWDREEIALTGAAAHARHIIEAPTTIDDLSSFLTAY